MLRLNRQGYLLAGFIIESVINKNYSTISRIPLTWMDYMRERILNPLGMRHSAFAWQQYSLWEQLHRAHGYIENPFSKVLNPDYPRTATGEAIAGEALYAPGVPMPRYILAPGRPPVRNATLGFSYNAGGAAGQLLSTVDDLARFFIVHLNGGKGYARNSSGGVVFDGKSPREVRILSEKSIAAMHNLDDPRLAKVETGNQKGPDTLSGLYSITAYGLGWMRVNWGGRYWNGPWNPDLAPPKGVRWDILGRAGIKRQTTNDNRLSDAVNGGLNVEGHGGDLPGYHTGMFKVSDRLAIIYLMNENFSSEHHDESRMQPFKFKHFRSRDDSSPNIEGLDGALPHSVVKFSEIEYLLLRKAASLQ